MSSILSATLPRFSSAPSRSLVVDGTAGGVPFLAIANLDGHVFFDVQDADVMATFDGVTAPTTVIGHRLAAGEKYRIHAGDAARAKFIRQSATSGRIQYSESN